jgi:hypothetical protein
MITLNEQIDASKQMLLSQGLSDAEADYFEKLCKGFTSKSVGLITRHFDALLKLANDKRDNDPDASAKVTASIKLSIDFTDIHTLNADYKISYTKTVTDTDGDREKLGEPNPEVPAEPDGEKLDDLPPPSPVDDVATSEAGPEPEVDGDITG